MKAPGYASGARRFWTRAETAPVETGHAVTLDGRRVRTPAGELFAAPTRAAAEAAAAEWEAQSERIQPETMPVTRAINTALDRVAPQIEAVRDEIAGYGASDLLCYRAPHPDALAHRQAEAWDPLLRWARDRFAASLVLAEGVMHVAQPETATRALRAAVGERDAFALTALFDLVTLSGSLVIGLAVEEGRLETAKGWRASRIDEDWQVEQWGEDAEASEAAARRARAFADAARLSALLKAP